jgi:NAD(P)H-hydrate epimerase
MTLSGFLAQIHRPTPLSHKGQNGKVLIVGGSDLFHAASQWSFKACSRLVDMTFYASVAENNELLRDAKFYATDGVVVPRAQLPRYLGEVDSILIGPGLRRDVISRFSAEQLDQLKAEDLIPLDWETDTLAVTALLLHGWPRKRWVIDAGSLQVMDPAWTPPDSILTPHAAELRLYCEKLPGGLPGWLEELLAVQQNLAHSVQKPLGNPDSLPAQFVSEHVFDRLISGRLRDQLHRLSQECHRSTFLLKGAVDLIWNDEELVVLAGGNAGLSKGGTGDTLAGLILGFRATSPAFASAVVAAWLNKQAAHELFETRGTMFNTSDLIDQLPQTWKQVA